MKGLLHTWGRVGTSALTIPSSYRESTAFEDLLRSTESRDPSVSIRPGAARNANCGSFLRECPPSPPKRCHVRPLEGVYGTLERSLDQSGCLPSYRMDVSPPFSRLPPRHATTAELYRQRHSYSPPSGTSSTPSVASTLARPPHREFTYAHLRPARGSTPSAQLFGVPYSEHSSFFELTCFALSLAGVVPPYRTPEYW